MLPWTAWVSTEMVSPCLTPLLILIFSLCLCRCTVTDLSVYICFSGFLCAHLPFLGLAMMSMLHGFVLSRMPSRNPRKQHTVVCCIHATLLFVYGMYVICRIEYLLLNPACSLGWRLLWTHTAFWRKKPPAMCYTESKECSKNPCYSVYPHICQITHACNMPNQPVKVQFLHVEVVARVSKQPSRSVKATLLMVRSR